MGDNKEYMAKDEKQNNNEVVFEKLKQFKNNIELKDRNKIFLEELVKKNSKEKLVEKIEYKNTDLQTIKEQFLENTNSDELAKNFLENIDSEELVEEFLKEIDYNEIADEYYKKMMEKEFESDIKSIEYYELFEIEERFLENVYVVKRETPDGKELLEVYMKDEKNKILDIDERDKVEVLGKLKRLLDEHDLERIDIESNYGNLRGMVEEASEGEMEKYLSGKEEREPIKENNNGGNNNNGNNNKEKENEKTEKKDENKTIENDLVKNGMSEDLGIMNYSRIIDDRMKEDFPETMVGAKEIGVAYSRKLNTFIMVVKTEEGYKMADEIEPSTPSVYNTISIDKDGNNVEEKRPYAMMRTGKPDKELAISVNMYGTISVEKVERTRENRRIASKLDMQGEHKLATKEVKDKTSLRKKSREELNELGENFEENKKIGDVQQNIDDIEQNEDMKINKANGDVIDFKKEAEKAKVSTEEFIRLFKEADGKTADEKLINTHEEIEGQYMHRTGREQRTQ